MLVIGRKPGQSFVCGDAVITVVRVDGNRVRLGIEAPLDTRVIRAELPGAAEYLEAWRNRQIYGSEDE